MLKGRHPNRNIIGFVLPIVVGLIVAFIFGIPDLYILSKRGVPTTGVVTSFDPAENDTAYTYSFGSSEYNNRFLYHKGSNPGYPNVGDKLNITVDPENPRRHRRGDVKAQLRDSLIGTILVIVVLEIIQLLGCSQIRLRAPIRKGRKNGKSIDTTLGLNEREAIRPTCLPHLRW
jgi:hypothetical protein